MISDTCLRVLLVDDDEDQLIVRALLLECAGFNVLRASDCESALARTASDRPQCAIIDLRLPTENAGLQLIRALKNLDEQIRLVVLTGANPDRLLTQPEAQLVDEVLQKPASSAHLVEHLKQLESQLCTKTVSTMAATIPFNDLDYIQLPPALDQIIAKTNALGFSMASEPRTGALLRTLAASKTNGRFLELGTGTGIATAWLLAGMDVRSTLTSIDTDSEVQNVAHEFLGSDQRLSLVLEDGLKFLRRQPADIYDFVFADAMPGKYEGLSECLRVVKPGGFYVIDDMLPQPNWPDGHAEKVPLLLQALAAKNDWTIVPLSWSSGIVLAVKQIP